MGSGLARNIASKGFVVSVFNRTTKKTDEFVNKYGSESIKGFDSLDLFVESLEKPRKILLAIKSGEPVDKVLEQLSPILEKDDIVVDSGNSHFKDSVRRGQELRAKNIEFVDLGVSGGTHGALNGPSIMFGGSQNSWNSLENILKQISADDFIGNKCVGFFGQNGAGHFVKMVHNGIEYALVQLLAEFYEIFSVVYKLSAPQIASIFDEYNKGRLESYLVGLTALVLNKKESGSDEYFINKVADKTGHKGTGVWSVEESLNLGVATPSIAQAVYMRFMSSNKSLRVNLNKKYSQFKEVEDQQAIFGLEDFKLIAEGAIYLASNIIFAQGLDLIRSGSTTYDWKINIAEVLRVWQGGCIIQGRLLQNMQKNYAGKSHSHLFETAMFEQAIKNEYNKLRKVFRFATEHDLSAGCIGSCFEYVDSYTQSNLPTNLISALRHEWGGHDYEVNNT